MQFALRYRHAPTVLGITGTLGELVLSPCLCPSLCPWVTPERKERERERHTHMERQRLREREGWRRKTEGGDTGEVWSQLCVSLALFSQASVLIKAPVPRQQTQGPVIPTTTHTHTHTRPVWCWPQLLCEGRIRRQHVFVWNTQTQSCKDVG